MNLIGEESTFCGVKIFVNPDDTGGGIILKGENPEQVEIDTILKNIKENSVVVDVGACYGEYTLLCAKRAKIVIAVEPNPYHFDLLRKGVEANGFNNVILVNKALSDNEGRASFYIGKNHLEGATLFKSKMTQELGNDVHYEEIQVEVTTLDKLLSELNINKIDILKLDAEGAERRILRGAENALRNPDLKMLTEFGTYAISSSGESPVEYLTYLVSRFKEVRILRDGKELGDGRDIIDINNIKFKNKIVCTNIFCQYENMNINKYMGINMTENLKLAFCQATFKRDIELTKECVERVSPYVDMTIISYDQSVTDSQIKWLEDNKDKYRLELVRYEWVDNMPEMRNSYLDKAKELGMDWICISDPDELYSEELCRNLRGFIEKYNFEGYNMIGISCRDEFINENWLDDLDKAKEQPGGKETNFWKPILLLKISGNRSDIIYEGVGKEKNVHETVVSLGRVKSINLDKKHYYTHKKNALKVWRNASRNMFIGGGGDNVGDENTLWTGLREITSGLGIDDWISFEKFVEKGIDQWSREKEKELKKEYNIDKESINKFNDWKVKFDEYSHEKYKEPHYWDIKENEDPAMRLLVEKRKSDFSSWQIEKVKIEGSAEYEKYKNYIEYLEKIENLKGLVESFENWLVLSLQAGTNSWQTETREMAKWYYALHPEEVDDFILGFIDKPPVMVEGSETEIANFVSRTYFDVLGRHPDQKGKDLYVGKIKDGKIRKEDLAEILIDSQEYKEKFRDIDILGDIKDIKVDINNRYAVEKYINDCYMNILRRGADEPGKRCYIENIMNGKTKPEELIDILKNSNEYRQKFGLDGRGGIDRIATPDENVVRPSPFVRQRRSGYGYEEEGILGKRSFENIDQIDSSKYNTVGLCIMGYSKVIPNILQSILTIGSVVDEIHIQGDDFREEDIRKLKEVGRRIGKDVEIHIVEWKDDFGGYKNKAVGHARTEWVLILDDDEIPTEEMALRLKDIVLKSDRGNNFDIVSFDVVDQIWDDGKNVYQNRNKGGKQLLHWNIPSPYFGDLHIWLKQSYYPWKTIHTGVAYRHIKTKDQVLERSARNVWMGGGGDTVKEGNPLWKELREISNSLGLKKWNDFKEYCKNGGIDIRILDIFRGMCEIKWKDDELKDLLKWYLKLHPQEEGRT